MISKEAVTVDHPPSDQVGIGWRIVRWAILQRLGRSARKVLLPRTMIRQDQTRWRWLRADVDRFLAATDREALALRRIARLGDLPTLGNRLMVELAVFTVAAYRVMLDQAHDAVDAQAAVADVGWDVYAAMMRLSSLPGRLSSRNPGRRLRGTIRLLLRFPFSAPGAPGYAVESWVEGEDIVTHFSHCPPQSFVRAVIETQGDRGEMEAFYRSWCLYDWPGADIIAGDGRRGHYQRHQTLSRGDARCDMCWRANPQPIDDQKA